MFTSIIIHLFFLIGLLNIVFSQQEQKLSFTSPELSEEEQHSSHLPSNLKCDACTAVAYQMTQALEKSESKFGGKKLKESDYLDVFENVCESNTWENYGLKSVDGVNRISGKGLPADDVPGMMYGGGKWPGRLMSKCYEIVGDIGEDDLYAEYRKERNLQQYLCHEYLNDCTGDIKSEL